MSNKIVVVGGGYSGLLCARRLAHYTKGMDVRITLVDSNPYFTERIRWHQAASGQTIKNHPYSKWVRGTNITFVQGRVTQLLPDENIVLVDTANSKEKLEYERLVYALGSHIDLNTVKGVRQHAHSVSTYDSTQRLQERLVQANSTEKVVICGAGLTGIELAFEFAESYPHLHISLLTRDTFGGGLSHKATTYLCQQFHKRGITLMEHALVQEISANAVHTAQSPVPFDVCVWAGAFAVPTLPHEANIAVNANGQILVDNHLRSLSHPNIYAVGDAASVDDAIQTPIRMGCKTAVPMGAHAADEISAHLKHQPQRAYDYAYSPTLISIGRRDGIVQMVDADGAPQERIFTGWLAVQIKEWISRGTVFQLKHPRFVVYTRHSNKEIQHRQQLAMG
jgi:NADH dehydrogenase FAD-containing subunit